MKTAQDAMLETTENNYQAREVLDTIRGLMEDKANRGEYELSYEFKDMDEGSLIYIVEVFRSLGYYVLSRSPYIPTLRAETEKTISYTLKLNWHGVKIPPKDLRDNHGIKTGKELNNVTNNNNEEYQIFKGKIKQLIQQRIDEGKYGVGYYSPASLVPHYTDMNCESIVIELEELGYTVRFDEDMMIIKWGRV